MRKGMIVGGVGLAGLTLVLAANYHFIDGSTVRGVQVESKPSLSLSETLINLDIVGNMPMIAARAQYPMYVAKLENRIADSKFQGDSGCRNVYIGMPAEEIVPKCGRPNEVETDGENADMRWDTGVWIKTERGKVSYVLGNK